MVTPAAILEALKGCYDPEIPFNIVDLGLVYDVDIAADRVKVTMTLTSPGCPLHAVIAQEVRQKLEQVAGVRQAEVKIVWQPPWTPERMSPEARRKLGWSKGA
ncbi:MAG: metal-sulfur cluster assembly factor [Chloroflexi bacterium]|nr:metal-sulfur cluster assembly factor [Chloroflexota bacterium]